MYKITKTVDNVETIHLVFDNVELAKEVFSDLRYDEYIRFKKFYEGRINKETREKRVNEELIYSEYKLSVLTFNIIIVLKYVED